MRITQWAEYGVHFSTYLARRERDGTPCVGAGEIAKNLAIELQYAQQILQRLRRGKIVESIRGPSGGYRLCRAASEITLLDIIIATEGATLEIICDTRPLNESLCALERPCGLRKLWFDLREHVNSFLERFTLEDLLAMPEHAFSEEAPVQIRTNPVGTTQEAKGSWEK